MAFAPLQASFSGGEISPRLLGRVDADAYRIALAECLNFEVLPAGPIRKRSGTRYVANLISGGSRLVPFKLANGEDYILELGNVAARIYTAAGRAAESETPPAGGDLVTNGGFTVAANWTLHRGSIASGRLRLDVGRIFDPDLKAYEGDPGTATQTIVVPVGGGDYLIGWDEVGGTCGVGLSLDAPGFHTVVVHPSVVTLPAGNVTLTLEADGVYPQYALVDNVSAVETTAGASFELVTPWTTEQLAAVQWIAETGKDRLILVHPEVAPFYVMRDSGGIWTWGTLTLTGAPAEWAGANWPGVAEVHAGRLWLGGTPTERNRLWASRVGDIADFRMYTVTATGLPIAVKDANSSVTPECALDFKVSTKAAIRWLQSQRTLLIGTDQSEHYVTGTNGPPSAGDIDVVLGSEWGSAPLQSLAAGDQAMYVSADRRRPRVIGFEFQSEGWVSRDLAFLADHITKAVIDEFYWVKNPNPCAVFVLADGTLAVCAYDRAAQQLGWWRLELEGGARVNSACVTDGSYGSIVWLSVQRGATACLETFRLDGDDYALLDGQVSQALPANLTASGLDHLEGQEVEVVVNRAGTASHVVVLEKTVAAGVVVLTSEEAVEGDTVHVGIGFTARAKTLPLEGGNPRGTAQGTKRRFAKIIARVNESALPLLNGKRAAERHPSTLMDQGEPAFTGDVEVSALGWEDNGQITVEQDAPLRTEILALFGIAQVNP